jgi:hypothetical protein
MRHLWSLLAGVLAAPLAWGLIAVGQARSQQTVTGWVDSRGFDTTDLIEPASYLVVAGILLGLIATLRISPLGPLIAGLLLSAVYAGMFVEPLDVRNAVPDDWDLFNRHIPLRGPLDNGTVLLVGMLLLVAMFSGQRWRVWPTLAGSPEAGPEPGQEPGEPGTPEPAVAWLGSTEGSAPPPPLPQRVPAVAPPAPPGPAQAGEPQPPEENAAQSAGTSAAEESPTSGGKPAASGPARRPPGQSGPPPTESPWAAPPRATRPDQD